MEKIANLQVYNDGMRKSMLDKIWFLDKIDSSITAIYDYGCADGSLLRMVGEISPNMKLYGYDVNSKMVEQARKTFQMQFSAQVSQISICETMC